MNFYPKGVVVVEETVVTIDATMADFIVKNVLLVRISLKLNCPKVVQFRLE